MDNHLDLIEEEKLEEGDYYLELEFFSFHNNIKVNKKVKVSSNFNHPFLDFENVLLGNYYGFMKYIFKDCEIEDCQCNQEVGHPDFKLKYNGNIFFVEFKNNNDSISKTQINWLIENKEKTLYFLFVSKIKKHYEIIEDYISI